jgi:hypothetical protein
MSEFCASDRCRRIFDCVLCLAAVFISPASALAQVPGQTPPGHADVIPGVIVFFGVVLGIILVCRSAGRTAEVKLEELDDE